MTNKAGSITGQLSPEILILGYLCSGPRYGYEMHKQASHDLADVWHISQSQLYSIIKRLAARNEIVVDEVPQDKLPARQLLHLTEKGRERFNTWLGQVATSSARVIRLEFVTRCYFLGLQNLDLIEPAFTNQISAVENSIRRLEKRLSTFSNIDVYNRMSIKLRIMQLEVTKKWLVDWSHEINS